MKNIFAATQHYVLLALRHQDISFPTTKKEIIAKAGQELVRTDWDKYIPLADLCKDIKLESYTNKAQFFNALMGTLTKFNF